MKKLINTFTRIAMLTLLFGALTGCVESVGDPFEPSSCGNNNLSLYFNGEAMRQTVRTGGALTYVPITANYYERLDTLEIISPLAYANDKDKRVRAEIVIIIPSPKDIKTAEKEVAFIFNTYGSDERIMSKSSLTIDSLNLKNGGHISGTFRFSGVEGGKPIEVTNGLFDIQIGFAFGRPIYGRRLKQLKQ